MKMEPWELLQKSILWQEQIIITIWLRYWRWMEPVNIAELVLQTEEVEEVQWFDLEEVYEQCGKHREIFCVPALGLGVVRRYLKSIEKN